MLQVKKIISAQVANALPNSKTIFLDNLDNKVKTKDSSGNIVTIATVDDITSSFSYQTSNYNLEDTDEVIECDGTFQITLPLLSEITHYNSFTITNSGLGIITIQTTNNELLGDAEQFNLYPQESLSFQKGNITYIVK